MPTSPATVRNIAKTARPTAARASLAVTEPTVYGTIALFEPYDHDLRLCAARRGCGLNTRSAATQAGHRGMSTYSARADGLPRSDADPAIPRSSRRHQAAAMTGFPAPTGSVPRSAACPLTNRKPVSGPSALPENRFRRQGRTTVAGAWRICRSRRFVADGYAGWPAGLPAARRSRLAGACSAAGLASAGSRGSVRDLGP